MANTNQIHPGMTLKLDGRILRVESSVKVTVAKATPFIKTKLRDLVTDEIIEKNFKPNQNVDEVALKEHTLEYLYPEEKNYLFLDIENLNQVLVSMDVLGEKIHYLKEGTQVKAMFYGEIIFSVELPQFLELMVVKTEALGEDAMAVSNTTKKAVLETGAKVDVPLFIEIGDVIKADTQEHEYIQRV